MVTIVPKAESVDRLGNVWDEISFGMRSYLKTPRLRGLLVLYLGVACASAMVIVNTVVYVRDGLGGSAADTALALAAAGGGSMVAALCLPLILDRISDRPVMLSGAVLMAIGLLWVTSGPQLFALLPIWFLVGLGWSLVQTPAGRVINRSAAPSDRSAYFSAQFSLSHACWLLAYPLAGQMGAYLGIETTSLILGLATLVFTALAALLWPSEDQHVLEHEHELAVHSHLHSYDDHHQHDHDRAEPPEPHTHSHRHTPFRHAHAFFVDDHHQAWP